MVDRNISGQISDLILYSTVVMTRTTVFPELPYFRKVLNHELTDGIAITFIPNLQFDLITVSVSRQYGDSLSSTYFHFHKRKHFNNDNNLYPICLSPLSTLILIGLEN